MLFPRVAAFTISALLLTSSVEPGWGWYLGLCLLTLIAIRDLVSLVAFLLSGALLVGLVGDGQAAFITLTIFTGATLLLQLGRIWRRSPQPSSWRWGRIDLRGF